MLIYQIYPRSFFDSNADGIGDLAGLTLKLPHIAKLGADAVWISPFVQSPQKDFGYDVSDYRAIDPLFGNPNDFKKLIAAAHRLGLKVMMDQVWCHCSDQHVWFKQSRKDKKNSKADWFIWANAAPDGTPPNNWLSYFGGPAWSWDTKRQQYYFHQFLPSQPTFNLRNKAARKALLDVGRFWLELGVDGFRFDAIHTGFADPQLRNNPVRPKNLPPAPDVPASIPQARQIRIHSEGHKDTLKFLEDINRMAKPYGAFLLGEVNGENPYARAADYTRGKRLHSAYSFGLLKRAVTSELFEETVVFAEKNKAAPMGITYALSNHDVPRVASAWAAGVTGAGKTRAAKLALLFGLTLPGHYCLYQGEELGLPEADVPFEKMVDPFGLAFYPEFKGRDGCRTPMPWQSAAPHGGFSKAKNTWLPFASAHRGLAVDRQSKDKNSVLVFTQKLIAWRKQQTALQGDGFQNYPNKDGLVVYARRAKTQKLLVVINPTAKTLTYKAEGEGVQQVGIPAKTLQKGGLWMLPPMSGVVLEQRA